MVVNILILWLIIMQRSIKPKKFGFGNSEIQPPRKNSNKSERLISWSPWPQANFKDRYPAFPFVFTLIIIITINWYFSLISTN